MVGKWLENKVYTRWVPYLVNVGYKDSTPSKCGGWAPHPVKWWNMVGILLENGWKMVGNGRNMVGIWLEYCWNIVGIWLEYGWKMVGKWLENKVYIRWVPHLVNVGYKDSTPCKCGGLAPHPVKWWNMVGKWLENGWKLVGNGRNMVGIWLENVWKMVGK